MTDPSFSIIIMFDQTEWQQHQRKLTEELAEKVRQKTCNLQQYCILM